MCYCNGNGGTTGVVSTTSTGSDTGTFGGQGADAGLGCGGGLFMGRSWTFWILVAILILSFFTFMAVK